MVRNPSELARLEEERFELYEALCTGRIPNDFYERYPANADKGYKSIREGMLQELHKIESQLGIDGFNYNSDAFSAEYERLKKERA